MKPVTENIIEESAIEILQSKGWEYVNGKEISPEGLFCERENFSEVVLTKRLRGANGQSTIMWRSSRTQLANEVGTSIR